MNLEVEAQDVNSHTLNLCIIFKAKNLNACRICITIGILNKVSKILNKYFSKVL